MNMFVLNGTFCVELADWFVDKLALALECFEVLSGTLSATAYYDDNGIFYMWIVTCSS